MIVRGNPKEIAHKMKAECLIEPGGHNMLVYDSVETLRELFAVYAKTYLPKNEILLIATQYDSIDSIEHALEFHGVDVARHRAEGTLLIIDAQEGYQGADIQGTFKLAMSLMSRAKKEGRRGVTWMGDMGSFFAFDKVGDLIDYELFCPTKYDEDSVKTVCCYHAENFKLLNKQEQDILMEHHFKTILQDR